jgi:hypothetical protein
MRLQKQSVDGVAARSHSRSSHTSSTCWRSHGAVFDQLSPCQARWPRPGGAGALAAVSCHTGRRSALRVSRPWVTLKLTQLSLCLPRSRLLIGYSARSSPALSRFLGLGLPSASGRRRTDVAERRTTALDGHIAQRDYARRPSLFVKHRQPAHRMCPYHLDGLLDAVAEGKCQRLSAAYVSGRRWVSSESGLRSASVNAQ